MAVRLLNPRKKRKLNTNSIIVIAPRSTKFWGYGVKTDIVKGRIVK